MIKKFYSKIEKDKLLHIIYTPDRQTSNNIVNRVNISPDEEFLQSAFIQINEVDHRFKPHLHNTVIRETNITQEAWVVVAGLIEVSFYDLDGSLLDEGVLYPGHMSITFRGGHTYRSLTDGVLVYEFKTGPYYGQQIDKELINEE